jgi:hypothetical protein
MDLLTLDLPGIPKIASGKVREIFDLGEHCCSSATDRISAFDCILPNPIPHKGAVLTSISAFLVSASPLCRESRRDHRPDGSSRGVALARRPARASRRWL